MNRSSSGSPRGCWPPETSPTPQRGAAYERAIGSARRQNARLLELRAATGLVIHERRSGGEPTALALVASLCEWFAEEPEVAEDVKRANALLAEEAARM